MRVQVDIIGTDRVAAMLKGLTDGAAKAPKAVYRQSLKTLTKAIRYTPLDKGPLRASGKTQIVGNYVEISFGGAAAPYAVYVHEILTNAHPIGQAKFLERAVQEDAKLFAEAIAKDMKLK